MKTEKSFSVIEGNHKYIIELDSVIYTIAPLPFDVNRMEEDVAYVNADGTVFPYIGRYLPGISKNKKYGYYIDGKGERHLSAPEKEEELDRYRIERIVDLNVSNVLDQINQLVESDSMADVEKFDKSTDSSMSLTIESGDDFLTKVIKKAIMSKGGNIKRFKNQLEFRHTFDNTFSSLKGSSDMSLMHFFRWVDMLDLDFEIRVRDDNPDEKYPIGGEIIANREGEVTLVPLEEKDKNHVSGCVFEYEDEIVYLVVDRQSSKLIEGDMIEKGFMPYHIRLHDTQEIPTSIETQRVLINYFGTIFSKKKLVEGEISSLTESQARVIMNPSDYDGVLYDDHATMKHFFKIYNKETE